MKNKILIIVYMLLMTNGLIKAQPIPWILTGNTPAGGNFLGTTNAVDLNLVTQQAQNINFLTNNTQQAIILPNGNMGIGTIRPVPLLHLMAPNNAGGDFGPEMLRAQHTGDGVAFMEISDGAISQTQFLPLLWGKVGQSGPALYFMGDLYSNSLDALADYSAVMTFDTRYGYASRDSASGNATVGSPISNRCSFEFRSGYGTHPIMRIYPLGYDGQADLSEGSVAIGNFGNGTVGELPTAQLHTDGSVRFQGLTQSSEPEVIVSDANGNLYWDNYVPGGFVECGNAATASNSLPLNSYWDLNNYNFYFNNGSSVGPNTNSVGIGTSCIGLSAKLQVQQGWGAPSIGILQSNADVGTGWGTVAYGIKSYVNINSNPYRCAGFFQTTTSIDPFIDPAICPPLPFALYTPDKGGRVAFGYTNMANVGNYEVSINANGVGGNPALELQGTGWFGVTFHSSDSLIKTNVTTINITTRNLLKSLNAVQFYYDTVNFGFMNLPSTQQFGFIAQDILPLYPTLVDSTYFPTQYDSLGTTKIHDSVMIKGLNYTSFIPLLVSGYQGHDSLITSLQNQVDSVIGFGRTGGTIGSLPTGPTKDIYMALDSNNLYFEGQPSTNAAHNAINCIGVGYNSTSSLGAKVDIIRPLVGPGSTSPKGLRVINDDVATAAADSSYGIYSLVDGGNGTNFAAYFFDSAGTTNNYGVYSIAQGTHGSKFIGVSGEANGKVAGNLSLTVNNYGVYGYASCLDTGAFNNNYGVFGEVPLTDTANIHTFAGYFNGKVNVIGSIHCATVFQTSDQQFKQNVQPLGDGLSVINQLQAKTFYWDVNDFPEMRFSGSKQYGFIANSTQQVLADVVDNNSIAPTLDSAGNQIYPGVDYEEINYTAITPIAVRAIQQLDSANHAQKNLIDSLYSLVNNLTSIVNNCCANAGGDDARKSGNGNGGNDNSVNIHTIDLSSMNSAPILYQNIPNPFGSNGGTKIKYFIPGNITNAQISFFDQYGNAMTVFNITDSGMGELNVTSANLANGVYSYSLIIDNKVIDTKRMVKTQ